MRIIILGAGVVGTTTAYFLAKDGHNVTVIERQNSPGKETSFANGGFISKLTAKPWAHPSVPKSLLRNLFREDAPYLFRLRPDIAQWIWAARFLSHCNQKSYNQGRHMSLRLADYSFTYLKKISLLEGLEFDNQSQGIIELYKTQESLDQAASFSQKLPNSEDHPKVLNMNQTIKVEPALKGQIDSYSGTLFYQGEETGDAYKFTTSLANRANNLGVKFSFGDTVKNINIDNGCVSGVTTYKTTLRADAVVVSLGSYSTELLRQIGIKVPIFPLKGYSITLPIDDKASAPTHGIHEIPRRIVLSNLGDRIRCAGTAELTGFDNTIRLKRTDPILADTIRLFGNIGDPKNVQRWAGLRPMTPDCLPIIGQSRIKGLFLNTGHGSTGWTWACGSGRIIADIVNGKEAEIDISPLKPDRF